MVDSEGNDTEWSKNIVRITDFAQDSAGSFASQYNETAWFPVARDVLSRYMEVWPCPSYVCQYFEARWLVTSRYVHLRLAMAPRCVLILLLLRTLT